VVGGKCPEGGGWLARNWVAHGWTPTSCRGGEEDILAMTEELERLYRLQKVDTALAELRADLEELSDGTQERNALDEATAELERRQKRLAGHESEHRGKELDLGSAEAKRAGCMERAYGGVVSNPKELENLEKEIEALGRTNDRLEEEIIELLDEIDEDTAAVREQEACVAECAEASTRVTSHYETETARLSGIITEVEAEREQVEPQVEERLLKRYDQLREKNANLGVAEVMDGVCSGCHMTVPSAKLKRLSDMGGEVFCDNCKRFLYLPA